MRLYCLAALTLLIILQPAPRAFAFSTDPTSGVNSDGTPRFMDPDEQVHSFFFGGSNLSEDGWFDPEFRFSQRRAFDRPNQSRHHIPQPIFSDADAPLNLFH